MKNSISGLKKEERRLMDLLKVEMGRSFQLASQNTEYKTLQERISALENDLRNLKDNALKIVSKKQEEVCGFIKKELEEVRNRMAELQKNKVEQAVEIPKNVSELIQAFHVGVSWGNKPFIVSWVSPSKRFFIMTNPGHTSYLSRMSGSKYSPSQHYLMDCTFPSEDLRRVKAKWDGKDSFTGLKGEHGYDLHSAAQVKDFYCEGRLSLETREKWIAFAIKEETK